MNRIAFYLIIIVFHSLLQGCNNKKHLEESLIIELDFQKEMKSVHAINLIKDVDIISLDCQEVLIGKIDKVIKFDTIIYLMDKQQNRSIYLFNLQGDFIRSISNYGRGPKEYIQLTDMFIDPADSSLNVLSRIDNKLFKYDLSGEELRVIEQMPKSFTSMNKSDKGYIAYMGNYGQDETKPYNLWLLNENLETTDYYFEIDKIWESRNIMGISVFSDYKKMSYYITPMDYNIYKITDKGIEIKYTFDLGKMQWPKVNEADITNDAKFFQLRNEFLFSFYDFQETENHLIVSLAHQGQYLLAVYNKETKKTNIAKLEPYENKYLFSFGEIIGFDENTIYTVNEAWGIKRIWDGKDQYNNFEEKYPTQVKNLRNKFDTIREDGNPFLITYSIN